MQRDKKGVYMGNWDKGNPRSYGTSELRADSFIEEEVRVKDHLISLSREFYEMLDVNRKKMSPNKDMVSYFRVLVDQKASFEGRDIRQVLENLKEKDNPREYMEYLLNWQKE